jgi:hypothetical protein
MKVVYAIIVLLVILVLIIILTTQYAKKRGIKAGYPIDDFKTIEVSIIPDNPIGFGYKSRWIAVRSVNQRSVAKALELIKLQDCNWESGFYAGPKKSIFLSPPIDGWILITGYGLPYDNVENSHGRIKKILNTLSRSFGEAQFFETHRVSESHCWIISKNGIVSRSYSYDGCSGEYHEMLGDTMEIEKRFNLYENVLDFDKSNDFDVPDEEIVIKIAEELSINPTNLDERKDILGLGLHGEFKN